MTEAEWLHSGKTGKPEIFIRIPLWSGEQNGTKKQTNNRSFVDCTSKRSTGKIGLGKSPC